MKKSIALWLACVASLGLNIRAAQGQEIAHAQIGGPLIDVEVHDVQENYTYLSDYVGQDGKYLLVNFWTANCPRCHAGFVELERYAATYAKTLSVVGVMLSDNHAGWLDMYAHKTPFSWPNLSDGKTLEEGAAIPYEIRLYPTFVLVDPQGKILQKWSGFRLEDFQQRLQTWFTPLPAAAQ